MPDFKIETFEPTENFFGERSLELLKKEGKWTILFSILLISHLSELMEFADLADQYENLKKENAEIITVSTDTKFVHPGGRGKKMLEKVKFPMGADRTAKLKAVRCL